MSLPGDHLLFIRCVSFFHRNYLSFSDKFTFRIIYIDIMNTYDFNYKYTKLYQKLRNNNYFSDSVHLTSKDQDFLDIINLEI